MINWNVFLLYFGTQVHFIMLSISFSVSRGWTHLVRQKPLWKHVDLSPFRINLVNIRKLVFAYFSNSLLSLHLSGFLMSVKSTECISDSLLIELDKRCPSLKDLSITKANLAGVNSVNLPSKLSTLRLLKCNYPTFWLSGAFKQGKLDSMKHLDLAGSNGFGARDVECLTPKPLTSLASIRLSACYRVGHRGASRIADNCPNLQELDLHGVPLSNESLQKIGSTLTQLRMLDLGACTNSDNVLFDLHHLCLWRSWRNSTSQTLSSSQEMSWWVWSMPCQRSSCCGCQRSPTWLKIMWRNWRMHAWCLLEK